MARQVLRVAQKTTASQAIAGNEIGSSDFATLGFKVGAWETVCVWVDISATDGTTEVLDIEFQVSEDSTDGVDGTWAAMRRGTTASQTQAALTQLVADDTGGKMSPEFEIPCSDKGWLNLNMNFGGSSPKFTVDSIHLIFRRTNVTGG